MRQLLAFLLLISLAACNAEPDPEPVIPDAVTPQPETEVPEEVERQESGEEETEVPLGPTAYFMDDGTTAYFKGEGNEFAQLSKRTVHLEGDHIAVYEDNGGTVMLNVYRIQGEAVDLVKEEPEFYEEYKPTLEELQALEPIARSFEVPFEVGDEVDGMPVKELGVQVETPYQSFDDAILLENKTEEGALNRSYWVKGFGEVKREFIMEDGENKFVVTSSLEMIE